MHLLLSKLSLKYTFFFLSDDVKISSINVSPNMLDIGLEAIILE